MFRCLLGKSRAARDANRRPPRSPQAPPPIAISILHEALLEVYNARFALSRIRVYVGAGRGVGDDMDDETPATATK